MSDYSVPRSDYGEDPERIRVWRLWEAGKSRCPYCIGLSGGEWHAICDCDMAEEHMTYDEAALDIWRRMLVDGDFRRRMRDRLPPWLGDGDG